MNNQDIIRKAVTLADGWTLDGDYIETLEGYRSTIHAPDEIRDALAAQLCRQVDGEDYAVTICILCTMILLRDTGGKVISIEGPDRTMNTLRAIVESKVLENESND